MCAKVHKCVVMCVYYIWQRSVFESKIRYHVLVEGRHTAKSLSPSPVKSA